MRNVLGRGLSSLISTAPVPLPDIKTAIKAVAEKSGTNGVVQAMAAAISPESSSDVRLAAGEDEFSNVVAFEKAKGTDAETRQSAHDLEADTSGGNRVSFVPLELIANNPTQPRQTFTESELKDLADSIKTNGLIQPIVLRPIVGRDGNGSHRYEIVAGERRWRASKIAGLTAIPAIIRTLSDQECLELALIENIQRENLNPIELAQAYQRLSQTFSLSQEQVAEKVGKDRASVANSLRLLKLPAEIQDLVKAGELSTGHAKALLTIKESSAQMRLAKKAMADGLSVRSLEALVARVVVLDTGKRSANVLQDALAEDGHDLFTAYPEVVTRLRNSLGTKVIIQHRKSGKGSIHIDYYSEQELDRLVDLLSPMRQQAV